MLQSPMGNNYDTTHADQDFFRDSYSSTEAIEVPNSRPQPYQNKDLEFLDFSKKHENLSREDILKLLMESQKTPQNTSFSRRSSGSIDSNSSIHSRKARGSFSTKTPSTSPNLSASPDSSPLSFDSSMEELNLSDLSGPSSPKNKFYRVSLAKKEAAQIRRASNNRSCPTTRDCLASFSSSPK